MKYDIKISGGTLIDGTNSPRYRGDLGIKNGKIVAVGEAPGEAERTIDASGKVVCPGFIDNHTHYDAQVLWDQMMSISPWHGVTTVLLGNCGFGVAPVRKADQDTVIRTLENVEGMDADSLRAGLGTDWPFETFPQYLEALEKIGVGVNVGSLIGHTPTRLYVMGEDATEREATEEEVAEMRDIVRDAIKAGALGFATSKAPTHVGAGGKPVPSRLANYRDEILELAKVIGEEKQGIIQSTIGTDLLHDQFAEISKLANCNVTWTALLQGVTFGGGDHNEQLKRSAELNAEGARVFPQVSPRSLSFDMTMKAPFLFESLASFKPVSAADIEGRRKIYADPTFREAFKNDVKTGKSAVLGGWSNTVISEYPPEPALKEQKLFDVAASRGEDPVDTLLNLTLESDFGLRIRSPIGNYDEVEVEKMLKDPNVVVGLSDGGAHASQLCDSCYGTYLLGHWVREKGAIELEHAIWMLTSRVAEVINIVDRGRLEQGLAADVLIFDPNTVGAGPLQRVNDLPGGADRLISEASGIDVVIVNGVVLRQNNVDQINPSAQKLPGKILRGSREGARAM